MSNNKEDLLDEGISDALTHITGIMDAIKEQQDIVISPELAFEIYKHEHFRIRKNTSEDFIDQFFQLIPSAFENIFGDIPKKDGLMVKDDNGWYPNGLRYPLSYLNNLDLKELIFSTTEDMAEYVDRVFYENHTDPRFIKEQMNMMESQILSIDNINATSIGNIAYGILYTSDVDFRMTLKGKLSEIEKIIIAADL